VGTRKQHGFNFQFTWLADEGKAVFHEVISVNGGRNYLKLNELRRRKINLPGIQDLAGFTRCIPTLARGNERRLFSLNQSFTNCLINSSILSNS
jgi:hypothetical protein